MKKLLLSVVVIMLIVMNLTTLSTIHIPQTTGVISEYSINARFNEILCPLNNIEIGHPINLVQSFRYSIFRIKDRWRELLFV